LEFENSHAVEYAVQSHGWTLPDHFNDFESSDSTKYRLHNFHGSDIIFQSNRDLDASLPIDDSFDNKLDLLLDKLKQWDFISADY
jgi:hypothetical protein